MLRIDSEKMIVAFMIRFYFKRHHELKQRAPECVELIEYAHQKLDTCRYAHRKPTCSKCSTHCYSTEKRKLIRTIMRYAGPRMLLVRPDYAIIHLYHKLTC